MITYEFWCEQLDNIKEEEQEEFVRQSLRPKSNLHIFGRYFFPRIITGDVADCHKELTVDLGNRKTGAIIFPRGHGKTTWEKIDTIHDIVYNIEPVIVYVGNTLGDAQKHFESIKMELEDNSLLRRVYGNFVPSESDYSRKWSNTHFETTNGVNVVARGACKGRGVNIKNNRPTKIILDDVEDDEQVRSPDRREKLHNWFYGVIYPSRDFQKGFVKWIGTVIHPEVEVKKFYNKFGGVFKTCTVDNRSIEVSEPIWPNYFTKEKLLAEKEDIGTAKFNQEYMNDPIDDETARYKRKWIENNYYTELPDKWREWCMIVMAVDPNASAKASADAMGICVMALDRRDFKRYVLDSLAVRLTIDKQLEIIKEVYDKWQPSRLGIECVMNQRALYDLALVDPKNMRLQELNPRSKDKITRSSYVEPLVEAGKVNFSPSHQTLYEELIQFPNGAHDDTADAFFYANQMLDEIGVLKINSEKTGSIAGNIRNKKF